MNVSAKDKASGKEQAIRIEASGGLTEADIQRMIKEAEAHAEEDRRRKELVEARNQADAVVYTTEKALSEATGLPAEVKAEVEQAVAALKEAIKGDDLSRIRQATQQTTQAATRLAEAVARTSTAQSPGPGTNSGSDSDPGVVDAEFEEVDGRDRKTS